ncbi:response regulator [Parerythrobacter aurantius]|uniref:response regulator n=1 Tax=Parerythrobacter aurantius TaxID=3127706 RepID=UPI003243920F
MPARVLIVEDEFLIALEMEEVVRDLGHIPVGVADNLGSALALARDAETVDIALVDVNLADGATGPEIGRRLAVDFGVQVIFVTANTAQLGDGVSGTIGAVEKPVGVGELRQLIDFVERRRNGLTPPPPPVLRLFDDAQAA